MTFLALQDLVLDTLNLSSPEARTRIMAKANLRLRRVQSTLALDKTRRGGVSITTSSGTPTVVVSGVAKLLGLYDPDVLHQEMTEISLSELQRLTAQNSQTSIPLNFAIDEHLNDIVILRFYPIPNAAIALEGDCLLAGIDLVDDDDEPTFPVDFHDVLVHGVLADELRKLDKWKEASVEEKIFEDRLSDLRYFIAKTKAPMAPRSAAVSLTPGRKVWPYRNGV